MRMGLQQFQEFEKDANWFNSHLDELRKEYVNEFVAVEDGNVISSGKTVDSVLEKLKKMRKDPGRVLIEFVHEKGKTILL